MAAIVTRRRWTRQPQQRAPIDRAFVDPDVLWRGGDPTLYGPVSAWDSNSGSTVDTVGGIGELFTGSTASNANIDAAPSSVSPFTVALGAVFVPDLSQTPDASFGASAAAFGTTSGGAYWVAVGRTGSGNVGCTAAASSATHINGPSCAANTTYAAAALLTVGGGAPSAALAVNGISYAGTLAYGNGTYSQFAIGGSRRLTAWSSVAVFKGAVSLAWYELNPSYGLDALLNWSASPWQIFRPRTRPLYFGAAATPYTKSRVVNAGGAGSAHVRANVVNSGDP